MLAAIGDKSSEDNPHNLMLQLAMLKKLEAFQKTCMITLETLKAEVTKDVEVMKKTGNYHMKQWIKVIKSIESWFKGDGYTTKGKEIIATIE